MKLNILTSGNSMFVADAERLQEEFRIGGHEAQIFTDHRTLEFGEILFILSYFKILPESALALHRHNIVVHASDLPEGRGFSPMAWQIVKGRGVITFSLFEAVAELDAGPVYTRSKLNLKGTELFAEWKALQNEQVISMVRQFVAEYPSILKRAVPQSGEGSVYRRRTSSDDRLDPDASLGSQFDKVRVCDPSNYPAWFEYRGRKFRLRIDPLPDDA
jgi:methionyl-tRNA formyltransferase